MAKTNESEELKRLREQIAALEAGRETYTSQNRTAMEQALEALLNREAFSYDPAGDALYNRYKDYYQRAGRRAMEDTLGMAASLTGGYGNSYAQTAAQQAYGTQLQTLQEKIPELYQLALEKYRTEGDALQSRYDTLRQQEQQDYSRYRDRAADYDKERSRLQSAFENQRDYDFKTTTDQRDFAYKQQRDKVSDEQWNKKFKESVRQFNERLVR